MVHSNLIPTLQTTPNHVGWVISHKNLDTHHMILMPHSFIHISHVSCHLILANANKRNFVVQVNGGKKTNFFYAIYIFYCLFCSGFSGLDPSLVQQLQLHTTRLCSGLVLSRLWGHSGAIPLCDSSSFCCENLECFAKE